MNRWLTLSKNTSGPRYITDSEGKPFHLFAMARCQYHAGFEEQRYGNLSAEAAHFKALGCNCMRLACCFTREEDRVHNLIEQCGGFTPEGIDTYIDKYVEPDLRTIINAGLYVILDLHEYPPFDSPDDPNPAVIADYGQSHYILIWERLAKRYAEEPMIAMFELWNEPHAADQHLLSLTDDGHIQGGQYHNFDLNTPLRKWFIDCAETIRKYDRKHILLASDWNAGWGPGWAVTWMGHHREIDPECRNTFFSAHANAVHLGPRMEFFDDWYASICNEHNVGIHFGEIEMEGDYMTPEVMRGYVNMLKERADTHHYSVALWRPHLDERTNGDDYAGIWSGFALDYAAKI